MVRLFNFINEIISSSLLYIKYLREEFKDEALPQDIRRCHLVLHRDRQVEQARTPFDWSSSHIPRRC